MIKETEKNAIEESTLILKFRFTYEIVMKCKFRRLFRYSRLWIFKFLKLLTTYNIYV